MEGVARPFDENGGGVVKNPIIWDDDDFLGQAEEGRRMPDEETRVKRLSPVVEKSIVILFGGVSRGLERLNEKSKVRRVIFREYLKKAVEITGQSLRYHARVWHPEGIRIEGNNFKRPYLEILKEGVDKFQESHPDIAVRYGFDDDYFKMSAFGKSFNQQMTAEMIESLIARQISGKDMAELVGKRKIVVLTRLLKSHLIDLSILPQAITWGWDINSAGLVNSYRYTTEALSNERWNKVETVTKKVEESCREKGGPVSASEILFRCMEITDGDLNEAVSLMGNVLEHKSRGGGSRTEEVDEKDLWMQLNVLDEYSEIVSYNQLKENAPPYYGPIYNLFHKAIGKFSGAMGNDGIDYDFSLRNRTGLPYHAAYLVGLLAHFPPEVIMTMVCGEYLIFGRYHGLLKFNADLRLVGELYEIKAYLSKLSHGGGRK